MYNAVSVKSAGDNGYTLLELVISITLIALILLIVGTAVRLGLRSVANGERKIAALERFRTSLEIVESQIQSELSVATQEEVGKSFFFRGNSDSVRFPSNFSMWGNQRGYVTVTYRILTDERGKQELHAEESAFGDKGRGDVRLFDFFDRIYFDYFYKDPAEEKGKWVDEWPDADSAPEKIRLHLINGEREISLLIPVKVRNALNIAPTIAEARQQ
jgi:general secretion pathway protein J